MAQVKSEALDERRTRRTEQREQEICKDDTGGGVNARKGFALGLSVACSTTYGLGSVLVGDTNQAWPWFAVAPVSAGAGILLGLVLLGFSVLFKGRFERAQKKAHWRNEFDACAKASTGGVVVVAVGTLVAQLALIKLLYCPGESLLWTISFAVLSTVLMAAGAYLYIGYPGMANLDLIGERLSEPASSRHRPGHLPDTIRLSLEAELAMLRTMMQGLLVLYVAGTPTLLLGLDKASVLLGIEESSFARVPFGTKMWFVAGMVLLLVTCHAIVTGPVHGRHSQIMGWMRGFPHTSDDTERA